MKNIRSLIVFIVLFLSILACQREPGNLNSMKERMLANGYEGTYWQPSSRLEKMALNLIGIEDLLIYNDSTLNAFVFKVKEGKDPQKSLDQLESYVKDNVTFNIEEGSHGNEITWEQIKKDAKIRGQYLLLWFGENEQDLLRIFRFF